MPLVAWIGRDWFLIAMISTVPGFLCFLCLWWLPESPRWLCTTGQTKRAAKILANMAKVNGKEVTKEFLTSSLDDLYKKRDENQSFAGLCSFFGQWQSARNAIMLIICW